MTIFWIFHAITAAIVLVAAISERRTGLIPNALSLVGLAVGVAFMIGDLQFASHLKGFLAAFLPALAVYRYGWAGGGSVKVFAVCGLMMGFNATLVMWVVVMGGAAVALTHHRLQPESTGPARWEGAPLILAAVVIATLAQAHWASLR